jgi:hypothetical protein
MTSFDPTSWDSDAEELEPELDHLAPWALQRDLLLRPRGARRWSRSRRTAAPDAESRDVYPSKTNANIAGPNFISPRREVSTCRTT